MGKSQGLSVVSTIGTEPKTLRTWVYFLYIISVNAHLVLNNSPKACYKLSKLQNRIFLVRMISRFFNSGYNPMYYISILASICFNNHVELPCNPLIQLIGQMCYTKFKNLASSHNHVWGSNAVICNSQHIIIQVDRTFYSFRLLKCFLFSTISMRSLGKVELSIT